MSDQPSAPYRPDWGTTEPEIRQRLGQSHPWLSAYELPQACEDCLTGPNGEERRSSCHRRLACHRGKCPVEWLVSEVRGTVDRHLLNGGFASPGAYERFVAEKLAQALGDFLLAPCKRERVLHWIAGGVPAGSQDEEVVLSEAVAKVQPYALARRFEDERAFWRYFNLTCAGRRAEYIASVAEEKRHRTEYQRIKAPADRGRGQAREPDILRRQGHCLTEDHHTDGEPGRLEILKRALTRLPEADRAFFDAYYNAPHGQKGEVAAKVGLTPKAAEKRFARLKDKLRLWAREYMCANGNEDIST